MNQALGTKNDVGFLQITVSIPGCRLFLAISNPIICLPVV
jgi:hypothetical protein